MNTTTYSKESTIIAFETSVQIKSYGPKPQMMKLAVVKTKHLSQVLTRASCLSEEVHFEGSVCLL